MNCRLDRHTPSLSVSDSRGLVIRQVEFHRAVDSDVAEARVSRLLHDAAQNVIAAWDPRLNASGMPPNQSSILSLSGQMLHRHNVDSGTRIDLYTEAGLIKESRDSRSTCWQTSYDVLARPLSIIEQAEGQPARSIIRFTYAGNSPEAASHNQCAQVIREDDPAGTLLFPDYGLLGDALTQIRHFLSDDQRPDWPENDGDRDRLLEPGDGATSQWRFAATGESSELIDAAGTTHRSTYTVSGALSGLTLHMAERTPVKALTNVTYDADERIVQQTAGNGAISQSEYDPADGRLRSQRILRPDGRNLQCLSYGYDPVGNVVRIEDSASSLEHYANQRIDPVNLYVYDSLYQLIEATGREALGATIGPGLPELDLTPGDTSRLLNFTQHFAYDSGGNLLRLQHIGHQNYTRSKTVSSTSNRSLPVEPGQAHIDPDTAFDGNGNLLRLQSGQRLDWDCFNQLRAIVSLARQAGDDDDERYAYDAAGVRVRKTTTARARGVTNISQVRYLPGLELHHDGAQRLRVTTSKAGLCHLRLLHWDAGKPSGVDNDQQRYSFDDPQGSSALELDQDASLLTHEGYYPYGGSAWWAGRSATEARYRTVRYSGKERDASGLYYYGHRYYAPWLAQWISADPGGTVDGLNLYAMVGNNPVSYGDTDGQERTRKGFWHWLIDDEKRSRQKHAQQYRDQLARLKERQARKQQKQMLKDDVAIHRKALKLSRKNADVAFQQLLNHSSASEQLLANLRRFGVKAGSKSFAMAGAAVGATVGTCLEPGVGSVVGGIIGAGIGQGASLIVKHLTDQMALDASVDLRTSALSPTFIYRQAENTTVNWPRYVLDNVTERVPSTPKKVALLVKGMAATALNEVAPGAGELTNFPEVLHENYRAAQGITPAKAQKLEDRITRLIGSLELNLAHINGQFETLGIQSVSAPTFGNIFRRITPADLRKKTGHAIDRLRMTSQLGNRMSRSN